MREKGKAVETTHSANTTTSDYYNYSAAPDLPCKKHPSPSHVGICAQCLKDRLLKLVCSDCGEQRLSSCSCSELSDVGSVGRISFLLENERTDQTKQKPPTNGVIRSEEFVLLKRSSSSCVGSVKKSGLWRIVRFFRRKREKGSSCERSNSNNNNNNNVGGFEEKSEMWVFDYMGVSRSRSLCSFRGGSFHEESSEFAFSSAKISDFNGVSLVDSQRPSGFSEPEPRKSSGFKVKESDFIRGLEDSSGFIDLKLDNLSSTESSKTEFSVLKSSSSSITDLPVPVSSEYGILSKGGSCRITGMRKDKRGHKVWRWIFKHHPNWLSVSKKGEIHVMKT